jgi:hypothetical protein
VKYVDKFILDGTTTPAVTGNNISLKSTVTNTNITPNKTYTTIGGYYSGTGDTGAFWSGDPNYRTSTLSGNLTIPATHKLINKNNFRNKT